MLGTVVITSFQSLFKGLLVLLGWLPFLVFFSIISFMFLVDFQNPVDEYFVRLILRACFILILATGIAQMAVLVGLLIWGACRQGRRFRWLESVIDFFNAFPVVEIGIFSIAIFLTSPQFEEWIWILSALLLLPTLKQWVRFLNGPVRNLFVFAKFHQVKMPRINRVLSPFYAATFVDYFFLVLKRHMMPLVFVLVVMDFRIILPRLVEAGLSYQAFALFLSLVVSLHLLSFKQEAT